MSKKEKKIPEQRIYIYCSKCEKALCKLIDLPHLNANFCSNCGNKLTESKKEFMKEMNKRRVF